VKEKRGITKERERQEVRFRYRPISVNIIKIRRVLFAFISDWEPIYQGKSIAIVFVVDLTAQTPSKKSANRNRMAGEEQREHRYGKQPGREQQNKRW
jgi:hypothetical protein